MGVLALIRKWLFRILLGFFIISILWVLVLKWINPGTTLLMKSRSAESTIKKEWVSIGDLMLKPLKKPQNTT
jgi:hypothetical protein